MKNKIIIITVHPIFAFIFIMLFVSSIWMLDGACKLLVRNPMNPIFWVGIIIIFLYVLFILFTISHQIILKKNEIVIYTWKLRSYSGMMKFLNNMNLPCFKKRSYFLRQIRKILYSDSKYLVKLSRELNNKRIKREIKDQYMDLFSNIKLLFIEFEDGNFEIINTMFFSEKKIVRLLKEIQALNIEVEIT